MTVPTYRAGTGPQPDPWPATAGAAVDDLFRLHAVDLVRFALMLVGDQSTAEDVVQDAFLGLYRAWDRIRDPDAVLGYLRTAVLNGARSVHRSRGRARLLRVQHDPPVWSAEAAVMDGEDRRAVLAAIATLPQRQREVLALKYYLDLSERDVAPAEAVAWRLHAKARARARADGVDPRQVPVHEVVIGELRVVGDVLEVVEHLLARGGYDYRDGHRVHGEPEVYDRAAPGRSRCRS